MRAGHYGSPLAACVILGVAGALVAEDAGPLAGEGLDCPTRPRSVVPHPVSTDARTALAVAIGHLDDDLDVDLVSGSLADSKIAWYESDGGLPPAFTERVISTSASGPRSVFAIDVNGDQDGDVIVATSNDDSVAWWESDGGSPPQFTRRVITSGADNVQSVFGVDLDGDLDVDVLSASLVDDKVAWYENGGGAAPTFTEHVITTALDRAVSVMAFDLDQDGDLDVVAAGGNNVEWYESDGGDPPGFTARVVTDTLNGGKSVWGRDLDGDGDGDVLSTSLFDHTIAWYESDGGDPPVFEKRVIDGAAGRPSSVTAADMDGDLLVDVVASSENGDRIDWYQNDGGDPPTFTGFKVTTDVDAPQSIAVGDIDGDLDPDVASASSNDAKIAWFELQEPVFGACCLPDTTCVDDLCLSDCASVLAWRWEPDLTCAEVACPGLDAPAAFLVDRLSFENFQQRIADLAAFGTRYWDRPENEQATLLLRDWLVSYGYDNVVLDPYEYQGVTKHNVYATKVGTERPTEMYILGAHFDTFNINGNFDDAPGADDDGSGCASVLEIARVFATVDTDVSVRFVLWNNEETGLNGSTAYVASHKDLQGTMEEPTWLAMIQQDMIMWDHGPGKTPDADVEYQATADAEGLAVILGSFVAGAMGRYGEIPAEVSGNMRNTDSVPFMEETIAISARENTRDEIGDGSNPHWHQPSDDLGTYGEEDYRHGFNICKMIAGAVGELVNARPAACPEDLDESGAVDFGDILEVLTAWGPCGKSCPEDLDMSGAVDFGDVLAVLTAWGPC